MALPSHTRSRFRIFDARHGLPTAPLLRVAGDPSGDLWAGSVGGLHRVQRRGFSYFTAQDGLVGPFLQRIFRGSDGHLYAVSSSSVIQRFDGDHWTAVRPKLPANAGNAGVQQVRLLALLAEGRSYQSVASEMGITINTVRTYVRIVYDKLHVHSRSAAVAKALRSGII